jgi:hypothetical protein
VAAHLASRIQLGVLLARAVAPLPFQALSVEEQLLDGCPTERAPRANRLTAQHLQYLITADLGDFASWDEEDALGIGEGYDLALVIWRQAPGVW